MAQQNFNKRAKLVDLTASPAQSKQTSIFNFFSSQTKPSTSSNFSVSTKEVIKNNNQVLSRTFQRGAINQTLPQNFSKLNPQPAPGYPTLTALDQKLKGITGPKANITRFSASSRATNRPKNTTPVNSNRGPFGGSGVYIVPRKPTPGSTSTAATSPFFVSGKKPGIEGASASEAHKLDYRHSHQTETSSVSSQSRKNAALPRTNPFRPQSGGFSRPKRAPISVDRSQLSACQSKVADAVFNRRSNVFFTGAAGTGKSYLLKYIIDELRQIEDQDTDSSESLAITASTGIAAFHIGGTTIHSFSGIGIGQGTFEAMVEKVRKNKKASLRWCNTKYLVIDEVSMLDGDLFDKLDKLAQTIRRNASPFGGIQVIYGGQDTGDFFQLPPVFRSGGENDQGKAMKFCFESESWQSCIKETIVLNQIFRQRDTEFSSILNEARLGQLSERAITIFKSLSREVKYPNDGILATELYPTRAEVDGSNLRRLATLPGPLIRLEAEDKGIDQYAIKSLDTNTLFPKVLELKVNAQVILIKNLTNIHPSLVNGSLGVVTALVDSMFVNDSNSNLDSSKSSSNSNQNGKNEFNNKRTLPNDTKYPQVRFTSGTEIVIVPEEITVERHNSVVATRHQVPLLLSWALSIHKAQGQTLERVKVDLSRVFEKGQAYVALSRATSLHGLQVLSFEPHKVLAHPRVIQYYKACTTSSH